MDIKSFLRGIIVSQLKKSKSFSFRDKAEAVSFSYCTEKEKRELIALELQTSAGWDMLQNSDGPDILQLLNNVYVKKNLSAEKALDLMMDGLIRRYQINMDEMLEAEFMEYLDEDGFNCENPEHSLDRINRARDARQQLQAGC